MWSLEYVQVPIERKLKRCNEIKSQENPDTHSEEEDESKNSENNKKMDIIKQMQGISSHDDTGNFNKLNTRILFSLYVVNVYL